MNNPFMMLMLGTLALLSMLVLTPDRIRLETDTPPSPEDLARTATALGQDLINEISRCPHDAVDSYHDSRTTVRLPQLGTFTVTCRVRSVAAWTTDVPGRTGTGARLVRVFVTSRNLAKPVALHILKIP